MSISAGNVSANHGARHPTIATQIPNTTTIALARKNDPQSTGNRKTDRAQSRQWSSYSSSIWMQYAVKAIHRTYSCVNTVSRQSAAELVISIDLRRSG
jgi:hypothetical protein